MKIPIVLPVEDDELLCSYICRLAYANGFERPATFVNRFCYDKPKKLYSWTLIDERMAFKRFYEALGSSIPMYELYDRLALIRAYGSAFHAFKQFKVYSEAFYAPAGYTLANGTNVRTSVIVKPRICPICWKEKRIIRKSHNIDGVKVCQRHKIPLLQLSLHDKIYYRRNIFDIENYEPISVSDINREHAFAVYAEKFVNLAPDVTKDIVYEYLANEYGYYNKHKRKYTIDCSFADIIKLIMEYCPDFDKFSAEIMKYAICDKDADYFDRLGFAVMSPIRNNMVQLKCKNCGQEFITNLWAIGNGFGCPQCEAGIPLFDRLTKVVDIYSDHEYKLLEVSGSKIKIMHKCGMIRTRSISDFLAYKTMCKCETKKQQVKTLMERNPLILGVPGLTYHGHSQTFYDGIFTCDVCGRKFVRDIKSIRKTGKCPLCATEEAMRKATDDLTGTAFTVMRYPSIEDKSVLLKCNSCGTTFTSEYKNLNLRTMKNGVVHRQEPYRCPNCTTPTITSVEFLKLVTDEFGPGGTFTMSAIRQNSVLNYWYSIKGVSFIQNKIKRLVSVEKLLSPGKGIYQIPNEPVNKQYAKTSQVLEIIETYYTENDVFSLTELYENPEIGALNASKGALSDALTRLRQKGKITKVEGGYKLYETEI